MASLDLEQEINFNELEKQLQDAIDADDLYWKQNDAKLRAVDQRVATYEEFRDMVKAAHLKPLSKDDKFDIGSRPKSVWNSIASKKKQHVANQTNDPVNINCENVHMDCQLPTTSQEFLIQWRQQNVSDADRYELLSRMGPEHLANIVGIDLGLGLLGEIVQVLLWTIRNPDSCQSNCDNDLVDIAVYELRILKALTTVKRFGLALQFLNCAEKTKCCELFRHFQEMLTGDYVQDLAELGVTEWTLQQLANNYEITLRN